MCLAIYKPAGKSVKQEHLRNGFHNHSDGAGLAWAENGELRVKKGFFNFDEFMAAYEDIKDLPALIHFRKATHGTVNETNCHPFLFNDGKMALIHNGVLNIKCSIEGLSDTAHFVKLVMEPMVKKNNVPINEGALHYLISTSIGSDKMAVMDGNGETYIFNEDKGTWDEGIWYSNTSFRYSSSFSHRGSSGSGTNVTVHHTSKYSHIGTSNQTTGQSSSTGHSPNSTGTQSSDWRKQWNSTDKDDEAYIAFWKNSGALDRGKLTDTLQSAQKLISEISSAGKSSSAVIDIEEVDKHLDETTDEHGNVKETPKFQDGQMCEYGWYDANTEQEIAEYMKDRSLSREQAIIRVFNGVE